VIKQRRLLLLGAAALLAGCDNKPKASTKPFLSAVDITGADYGSKLSLPDQNGKIRTMADFKGKFTVVFFGYTQCPDVCPTTMAELAQVKKSLGKDGDRVQGVFITIDPERDTPELLKAYLTAFDPSFIALRGTLEQTAAAAKDFKVYSAKVPSKSADTYTMDHTAGSYVFDDAGRLRLFTKYGSGAEALAADLKNLISSAG
jgi:protein SCO1/2